MDVAPTLFHRNEQLEEHIAAAGDEIGPYRAYAEWLAANDDPRGELIAAHIAAREEAPRKRKQKVAAKTLTEAFLAAHYADLEFLRDGSRLEWQLGFVRVLDLSYWVLGKESLTTNTSFFPSVESGPAPKSGAPSKVLAITMVPCPSEAKRMSDPVSLLSP